MEVIALLFLKTYSVTENTKGMAFHGAVYIFRPGILNLINETIIIKSGKGVKCLIT